jgi:Fe2+ transport system protein B
MIGKAVEPLFSLAGYGFWQAGVALLFGFLAKEVVIGTFAALMGVAEEGLGASLVQVFTPLSSYAFLIMVLLYVPCLAALYTFKRETNSWKWMFFMAFYTTCVGWIASIGVYQIGHLLGFE